MYGCPDRAKCLGAYIGPAAKATATYLRYQLNVPDRKISQFFSDFFGLKFVPASAYGFERQAVRCGLPLYEDLRQKIRALPVAHGDETSWRHNGQPYWAWYVGNLDLAFFHLDAHRSGEAAQSVLGERFGGTLVADAYASYNAVHPKDRQSCLAHIKTKAKELEQELARLKGKAADPAARQFCQNIQGWVHTACQAHHRLCRGRWRAKSAKRKGQALRKDLRALCASALRYPKAEAFRQRLLGPEQKLLFTCFRRPHVPPTHNQAERSLRPLVIMRKVVQGTRSLQGLRTTAYCGVGLKPRAAKARNLTSFSSCCALKRRPKLRRRSTVSRSPQSLARRCVVEKLQRSSEAPEYQLNYYDTF